MADSDDDVPALEYAWILESLSDCPLSIGYLDAIRGFNFNRSVRHINDLPTELMANILKLAPVHFPSAPYSYEGSRHVLRMVSPYWNGIIEAEPAFWSQIYVGNRTVVGKLALWIRRARSAPISFAFHLEEPLHGPSVMLDRPSYRTKWLDLVATVFPAMAQCVRVSVRAHNPTTTRFILLCLNSLDASAVERIDLHLCPYGLRIQRHVEPNDPIFGLPPLFLDNVPRLRCLTFNGFFTTWGASPNLSNVTTLRLDELDEEFAPTVDEIFAVLSAAPRLETLFFLDVGCVGFETYTLEPPVMVFLDILHFSGRDDACSCLLSLVSMPAITTLYLQLHEELCVRVFVAHCAVMCGRVTTLSVDFPLATVRTVLDVFEAFPRLEYLDARDMNAYFALALHSVVSHWASICPALSKIVIDEYMEPHLLHHIHSRCNAGLFGKRPLQIISLAELDDNDAPRITCTSTFQDGVVVYDNSAPVLPVFIT
ncbi:hypothetical protein B0H16DRAFT_1710638 [Mycena metata]|uniref:F-box domain-containing protein n=1 Tax=Mycena metata TaxID=1033252 RepID=A0AAD7KA18_9AGAR|nr:hypothetical protein B0H16DRAFT_1710638 [Mycena metata]